MKAAATKRFVLDASVTVAWCFEDEASKFTESVLDLLSSVAAALDQPTWPVEAPNAVLIAEFANRIVLAKVTALLQRIAAQPSTVLPIDAPRAFGNSLPVARQ